MNEQTSRKLWVIKFCLKVVYPKYNYYYFLVYLAIRFRIWNQKRNPNREDMDAFEIKTLPPHILKTFLKERLEDNLPVLINKCIVISKEQFIQLGSENLFYLDNGVLWVGLKLTASERRKYKANVNENKEIKFNLHFMTSELHKKLWTGSAKSDIDNLRIVPIVGSKHVSENVAFTNEIEFFNINSCFGLNVAKDISVTFHPVPCLDSAPKIAAVAEVSLIVNDYDLANDFIKEVLSNHFEVPKLVSTNDIICIDLTPDMTAKYHYKYLDLVNSTGRLYFKCKKLSSDAEVTNESKDKVVHAFFIVKGVTQLTLGENIHSLKPKDEYFKPPLYKNSNVISQLCPTGLKEKFNQIQETIYPFLTGELDDLLSSMSSPIIPMLLLTGATGSGRYLLVKILAKYNGMNCLAIDCNALQSSTAKQTESKINSTVQKAKAAAPVIVVLDNFEVFAVDPENNEDCRVLEYFMNTITDLYQNYTKHPIVFIAITERQDLKPNVLRLFLEKFHIPRLNAQQRYEMLEWLASVMQLNIDGEEIVPTKNFYPHEDLVSLSKSSKDVLQRVAAKTETFLYGDIDTLLHFAIRESYLKQRNGYNQLPPDPNLHLVQEEDFNSALESIRGLQSQHLDAPKIPKVYWKDIGGLDILKKELLKTIEFPIKYPHLFKNSSLKRSGILLYGPPGCGKTLVAKAVSTELNVSFLSVKGPELLNMYIGQSEENVRKVFESARASSPCIVFLDELDALAPRRGAAGDSGGASDRVVSQLLAELDGVASGEDADTTSFVFIMGATNRPDLLEQSLLRPGRLDKLIYVGPYCGLEEKTCVLKALCRNNKVREEVDLSAVAAALPDSCTGADLLQVVSTARAAAVRALVAKLHAGAVKESELSPDSVIIGATELLHAVESFRPSVTPEELAYYESLKTQM
ncbi:peroxisome assembly factor 2-like [Trichoplusia ni]|uniref:Peroxisomal ATPase PEX6 n=1 Tax=Trichoplusia ni TaxID=7111 RepID=A0A7E5WY16_TRINI|nr:peroxisome assembly factor 2-like [Trichoplusia ni]